VGWPARLSNRHGSDGHIASVHKVGIGFRHEIAKIGIESIESCMTMGHPLEMRMQVLEGDNACGIPNSTDFARLNNSDKA